MPEVSKMVWNIKERGWHCKRLRFVTHVFYVYQRPRRMDTGQLIPTVYTSFWFGRAPATNSLVMPLKLSKLRSGDQWALSFLKFKLKVFQWIFFAPSWTIADPKRLVAQRFSRHQKVQMHSDTLAPTFALSAAAEIETSLISCSEWFRSFRLRSREDHWSDKFEH